MKCRYRSISLFLVIVAISDKLFYPNFYKILTNREIHYNAERFMKKDIQKIISEKSGAKSLELFHMWQPKHGHRMRTSI